LRTKILATRRTVFPFVGTKENMTFVVWHCFALSP
jgi:hypothetical protein